MQLTSAATELAAIAEAIPPDAPAFERLWPRVEQLLEDVPVDNQLRFAGIAIACIAEAIARRADWLLAGDTMEPEELAEHLGLPTLGALDDSFGDSGPAFATRSWLDANLLPEPLPATPRAPRRDADAAPDEPEPAVTRQQLVELAVEEDVLAWEAAVVEQLQSLRDRPVTLQDLAARTELPVVPLWLGLLHALAQLPPGWQLSRRPEVFYLSLEETAIAGNSSDAIAPR